MAKEKHYLTENAKLMAEWDWEKNEKSPEQYTVGSHEKVWWIGKCGHSWQAIVKDRNHGNGCPICAGKIILRGFNDFESNYPELAKEWNYSKNNYLQPYQVAAKSHKKVWWVCSDNHEYEMSIDSRARGRGCPFCNNKIVIQGKNDLESQNPYLSIEYSSKNGLKPNEVFQHSHRKVLWVCSFCGNEWEATIDSRQAGNGCPACSQRTQTSFPEQAIFYYVSQLHPDAKNRCLTALENRLELDVFIPTKRIGIEYDGKHWHKGDVSNKREVEKYNLCREKGITLIRVTEKGGNTCCDISISMVDGLDSAIKALGGYISVPEDIDSNRDRFTIMGNYLKALKKESFATKHPALAEEWNYEKNGNLTPDMFFEFSSQIKLWWKCKKGHEWQSTIAHRTAMKSNCPYCSNRKLLVGFNDFATTCKDERLFNEWDDERNSNEGIFMTSVMLGSKKKVWWKCEKGHIWKSSPESRKKGENCPYCSSHRVLEGFNDLQSQAPDLAKEWNYKRNNQLLPTMIAVSSNKKVWWECKYGHEWETSPNARRNGQGCPFCSNHKVLKGFNDLATSHPELVLEWNEKKNNGLTPYMVTSGSGKRVWWLCKKCGLEWQAAIKDRTRGSGCPHCYRNKD